MGAVSTVQEPAGETLPALIDRAARTLANARTSAEVLEARDLAGVAYDAAKRAGRIAKAKDAHDTLVAAAHRAQADALLIESQAKRRLADEYDAAQRRGEVAKLGTNQTEVGVPSGNTLPTAADIGLTRKSIFEARQIRDAEAASPGIVARALNAALERGAEPTRAEVRRAIGPSEYLNKRAGDEARAFQDKRDFKAFRKLWRGMSATARQMCADFIESEGR